MHFPYQAGTARVSGEVPWDDVARTRCHFDEGERGRVTQLALF